MSMLVHKLPTYTSLALFLKRELLRYTFCKYFCVDRSAATENDDDFFDAILSLRFMHDARIIVYHPCETDMDNLVRRLLRIGVTNIITATDDDEKYIQALECLSPEGMQRYGPLPTGPSPPEASLPFVRSLILKAKEDEQYLFGCTNVTIGIIGATRRVGTTTAALGLANYIGKHGGTACYVAFNTNFHLDRIAETYGFDKEDGHYVYGSVDFYEAALPERDYNFIVMDYGGAMGFGDMIPAAIRKYKESNAHVLCGACSASFEIDELADTLEAVKSVRPYVLTREPDPTCSQLFAATVTKNSLIVQPVKSMLDYKENAAVYKEIINQYIIETSKRL
jgi:hypothetical protein